MHIAHPHLEVIASRLLLPVMTSFQARQQQSWWRGLTYGCVKSDSVLENMTWKTLALKLFGLIFQYVNQNRCFLVFAVSLNYFRKSKNS